MTPENSDKTPAVQIPPPLLNAVTLGDAETWTNYWRQDMKQFYGYDEDNVPKGVYISAADLKAILDYPKATGARAYFIVKKAGDNQDPPMSISLLIVPAILTLGFPPYPDTTKDIIDQFTNSAGVQVISAYDVTRPCPPLCDPDSDLMP